MWGANGWPAAQGMDRSFAGSRGDHSDGQGGRIVERWQQSWDRPREEGLAGARRTQEEQAVPAGQGDLERPPRLRLAANLGKIRDPAFAQARRRRFVRRISRRRTLHELDPRR